MQGLPIKLPFEDISYDQLLLCKSHIAGYFFDGFLDVSYSSNTVVTSHQIQKGASISDHAYVEPIEITMTVKMSDAMSGMIESQFQGLSYSRSVGAFKILRELQKQRLAFQINTRLETYENMMITSLQVNDDISDNMALTCTVGLKQVLVAQEKTVKISKRQQVTTTYDVGTVQASTLQNKSLLLSMFGKTYDEL